MREYIVGTRGSQLAIQQTKQIIDRLHTLDIDCSFTLKTIETLGDKKRDIPLHAFTETGIFTNEMDEALLNHSIDLAIHSLKDLDIHAVEHPHLIIATIPKREDVRDVFISRDGRKLEELDAGAIIGTSSLRRRAQLIAAFPQLNAQSIRGPIDERIDQLFAGRYDGIILAAAGIHRLGKQAYITQYLPVDIFTPAAGQGALALQCRKDDSRLQQILLAINDPEICLATSVEREFIARVDREDRGPVGAYAYMDQGLIHLNVRITSIDGKETIQHAIVGSSKEVVIEQAVEAVMKQGAKTIIQHAKAVGV